MKDSTNGQATRETKASGKVGRPRGPGRDLGEGASGEARKRAATILEVLAGIRTPTQAAEALGVSPPRYYLLEVQALQGMLVACEPRTGRGPTAESALATLRRECEQLQRECARQQALVRAAQRTIGLSLPAATTKPQGNGKRRRRRPMARALRAAARLKLEGTGEPSTTVVPAPTP